MITSAKQSKNNWHLHHLQYVDGSYFPQYVKSFDTIEEGIKEQRRLQGQGIETQLSNVKVEHPHKIYNLGTYGEHYLTAINQNSVGAL